jgi:hypothetical protein
MTSEMFIIGALVLYSIIREVLHFLQVNKLQELLKSNDITEYYRAKEKKVLVSPSQNTVMEQNEISSAEDDFDIRKVSKVIVDGEEKPINIL